MTGQELKQIVERRGVSSASLAFAMGLASPMALYATFKSPDVKSGHLESAARALGMTIPEMYAALDEQQAQPKQHDPEPEQDEAPAVSNDIQQVLIHLTAVVTAQTKKIDDLTHQVAELSTALRQRSHIRYTFDQQSHLQVADQENE